MFDGSYRSKKTINLSTNNKRRAVLGKTSILEKSKIEREKRLEHNLKDNASRRIQKIFRGWRSRKAIFHTWFDCGGRYRAILLIDSLVIFVPSKQDLLLSLPIKEMNRWSIATRRLIVLHSLRELTDLPSKENAEIKSSKMLLILIQTIMSLDNTEQIYTISKNSDMNSFLFAWIECCKTWLWKFSDGYLYGEFQYVALELLRIVCIIENRIQIPVFSAHLATIILGLSYSDKDMILNVSQIINSDTSLDIHMWYASIFKSFVTFAYKYNYSTKPTILKMIKGREAIIIINALDAVNCNRDDSLDQEVILFLYEILIHSYRSSADVDAIVMLLGLAASGSDLNEVQLRSITESSQIADFTEDNDKYSFESSDEDEQKNSNPSDSKGTFLSLQQKRRSQRLELQTASKLNHMYKLKLQKERNSVLENLRKQSQPFKLDLLRTIAMRLGKGDIYLKSQNSSEVLISLLYTALAYCSGTVARDSAMSPLLSKVAFHPTFKEGLWMHIKHKSDMLNDRIDIDEYDMTKFYESLVCFCDVFTHQLLALDDEEFLLAFTPVNSDGAPRSKLVASDIVQVIKTVLYDLYWSNPVSLSDLSLPMHTLGFCRVRLLLSGTKLWNALYTRWSRLYRSSNFCDESAWWFPHLVSQASDENGVHHQNIDAMDIDDDDSLDSLMEINTNVEFENEALASSFKDPKIARILTSIPQALPFDRRAKLFSSLLNADIRKTQDESEAMHAMMINMQRGIEGAEYTGSLKCNIRRDHMYEDSMEQLNKIGSQLKKRVQVTFIDDKTGKAEAGIDGGGLFKEFIDDLIKEAFNSEAIHDDVPSPLFRETSLQTLSINTSLKPSANILSHYQFLGRVLGKAVYESILVEPQFCLPFLNQLLGQQNTIDDLKNVDPEYYRHLTSLRKMSSDDIESLGLTFDLSIPSSTKDSPSQIVELIPNGSCIPVTKDNSIRYIHLVAYRRLNTESAAQTKAFLSGFRDIIPAPWVKLFSPYELQKLISGDDSVKGFDVLGLKKCMQYSGGYHPDQPIMQWFWQVLEEMEPSQQRNFLKFMTSCSRQPLLGFNSLAPLPCIQQVRLSLNDTDGKDSRLPTSSTCMNLLKLPNYPTKEILKTKLLYAIESKSGFELS